MGWKREFTYAELQAATDGFSDENCLSVGGLWTYIQNFARK